MRLQPGVVAERGDLHHAPEREVAVGAESAPAGRKVAMMVSAKSASWVPAEPIVGPRIGIRHAADAPWRWHVPDHVHVSRR